MQTAKDTAIDDTELGGQRTPRGRVHGTVFCCQDTKKEYQIFVRFEKKYKSLQSSSKIQTINRNAPYK